MRRLEDALLTPPCHTFHLNREGECPLPEFTFKANIISALCMIHTEVSLLMVTVINDSKYLLEFESGVCMKDVGQGLHHICDWLGIPVKVVCTIPTVQQVGVLNKTRKNAESTEAAPETLEMKK